MTNEEAIRILKIMYNDIEWLLPEDVDLVKEALQIAIEAIRYKEYVDYMKSKIHNIRYDGNTGYKGGNKNVN